MVIHTPRLATARSVAVAVALAALSTAACVHGDYECRANRDCDVGEAGRCELDHRCTAYDPICATHRRYSDHSGPSSSTCFDDHTTPANRCAAGQPPALSEGCIASVCTALPACCATGWSDSCVQQAQLACSDLVCDTRIAITAADKAGATELWDLRWDGAQWSASRDPRTSVLAWLAPAPGELAPRLAGFADGALQFDGGSIPVAANHDYLEVTSVDFDRDGRATAVLGYTDGSGSHLDITKLDDGTSRSVNTFASHLAWGDLDHDAFPDALAAATGAGNGTYRLISNAEAPNRSRQIGPVVETNMNGGNTPGSPAIRSFQWLDANRDHQLDAFAFGAEIAIHVGQRAGLTDTPQVRIDCSTPQSSSGCSGTTGAQAAQAFAGTAVPEASGAALLIARFPAAASPDPPALFRATLTSSPFGLAQLSSYIFPATCAPDCPPILAVLARDLDGDHILDTIAIDATLQVYTAIAPDLHLTPALKLKTDLPSVFDIRTSVTGAPR